MIPNMIIDDMLKLERLKFCGGQPPETRLIDDQKDVQFVDSLLLTFATPKDFRLFSSDLPIFAAVSDPLPSPLTITLVSIVKFSP